MAERPEDLNLPITIVQRIIKEAVSDFKQQHIELNFKIRSAYLYIKAS